MSEIVVGAALGAILETGIEYAIRKGPDFLSKLNRWEYKIEFGQPGKLTDIRYETLAHDPKYHEAWGWRYFQQGLDDPSADWFEKAYTAFSNAERQTRTPEGQVYRLLWQALAKAEAARTGEAPESVRDAHALLESAESLAEDLGAESRQTVLSYVHRLRGFVYHSQGGKDNCQQAKKFYNKAVSEGYEPDDEEHWNKQKDWAGAGKDLPNRDALQMFTRRLTAGVMGFCVLVATLLVSTLPFPWPRLSLLYTSQRIIHVVFQVYQALAARLCLTGLSAVLILLVCQKVISSRRNGREPSYGPRLRPGAGEPSIKMPTDASS